MPWRPPFSSWALSRRGRFVLCIPPSERCFGPAARIRGLSCSGGRRKSIAPFPVDVSGASLGAWRDMKVQGLAKPQAAYNKIVALTGESSTLALRDPDIRLMLRVRDDDASAFAELVDLYNKRLVTVMHHLVGNSEEAEDLAQEVFLRVYRGRKKYHARAKFATWLF